MSTLSQRANRLILEHDGLDQPAEWPEGSSGITIGIGYDLGYVTFNQFESDWCDFLSTSHIQRLKAAVGLWNIRARNRARQFSDIVFKRADSEKVSMERTFPPLSAEDSASITEHIFYLDFLINYDGGEL